jgi:hypothetical protein
MPTPLLRDTDVRRRLRRDVPWILAVVGVLYTALVTYVVGFGWDAHAYWQAWRGEMYTTGPNTQGAYLYSPAFAHLVWPLAQLPWPLFAIIFALVSGSAMAWLLRPLGLRTALPLWLASTPEIASGNIFALLGVVAVVGMRHPSLWALAALTKVTPCLGPVWFATRGEWRRLASAVAGTLLAAIASFVISPEAWTAWITFLATHVGQSQDAVGSPLLPGPLFRVPVALGLVIWGARTNRAWTLPVAMCVATPVFGFAAVTMCAAIPRLTSRLAADAKPPVTTAP